DVCINYDKEWFAANDVAIPQTLDDLRSPEMASLLVCTHPSSTSPGLAFVLATIAEYGEDGWLDFWADLHDGGVRVESSWSTAYYETFTRYGGDRPLVLSYASSPPAEAIFADPPVDEAPAGVMTEGCYRRVGHAGSRAGTDYPEAAGRLIACMRAPALQEQTPESWFVSPAEPEVDLPPRWAEHTVLPDDPAR